MAEKKTYVYCNVLPANYQSPFFYICDFDVKPGDIVVIPLRAENSEKVGLVLDTNEYTEANAPYPPQWTKHILRMFGDDESASLKKEKVKVEIEKAIRFKSDDQYEKIVLNGDLVKYGVGKKLNVDKARLKELNDKKSSKDETISDNIVDLSGCIILSADGKIVTGFKARKTRGRVAIRIPSGVETIEDNVFLRVEIDNLYLPKELKYLGKYTINHPYGRYGPYEVNAKNVRNIEVEDGNENFASDGEGFYSIEGGKKKLLRLLNKNIATYVAPDDVNYFEVECFSDCPALKHIVLSEGTESFDEYALPHNTQVEDVFIPKTVKRINAKGLSGAYSEWNTVAFRIDEKSEYLFRDEDSIYEVLDDGTYKLVTCFYTGKGKVLLLEGTSVIGSEAFEGHKNITSIEFPKSLRVIGGRAFAETGLKNLIVPDHVQRIENMAFSCCNELKSVQLYPSLEYIAEDAFDRCPKLKKIMSEGSEKEFSFKNGIVKRIALLNQAKSAVGNPTYAWMAGKIFVHTGLSETDEHEFKQIVNDNGGEVKSSTVLKTDYLVYNADYDHETRKLRRARELQDQGKEITILTFDAWNKMLKSAPDWAIDDEQNSVGASVISNKDYFAEFAQKIVETITEESVSSKDHISDRVKYDDQKRVVSMKIAISQRSQNPDVVKERVACAESLKENDPVRIILRGESWEVASIDGKSLGELSWLMARQAIPYLNIISISEGAVASITPKSKRRANSIYAQGSVSFDITERQITENISEQDLITRTQFAYSVDDKEAHLIRWIGDASIRTAVIPATVEGMPIISVNPGLFKSDMLTGIECHVEEIVVSEGVKRLEAATLFYVENLKKVVLPASIDYISPDVFAEKDGQYRNIYMNGKTIYVVPAGSYAEKFLKSYKTERYDFEVLMVVNDDSAESTDELKMLTAFNFKPNGEGFSARFRDDYTWNDFRPKNVSVPATMNGQPVTALDMDWIPGFVQKIIIPATVINLKHTDLSYMLFDSRRAMRSIEIAEDNPVYSSDGQAIFSKDKKTLLIFLAYRTKEYTIPEGTEKVAEFAFAGAKNLERLVLPKSIKAIRSHAFGKCSKLADIQGTEYVSEVGEKIFTCDGWGSEPVPFVQKSSVLIIGSFLLKYNELSEKIIEVPEGITKICESAFGFKNENDCVEEIVLPASVQVIERDAFYGRSKLKKINIPDNVKEICRHTFACCGKLERIYIPASVEKIDVSAFPTHWNTGSIEGYSCAFKALEVDPDNKSYCSENGMLLSKDRTELLFVPSKLLDAGFEIPIGVKVVNDYLAYCNMALTELVLPDTLTQIGRSAFAYCHNLEKVVFPERLESIGENAFSGCIKLETVVLPKNLKSIGENAFSGCEELKTVVWSKNLKSIGNKAFYETGLKNVTLPDTLTHIGSEAFAKTGIQKVILPKHVQTLGWGAFSCVPEIEVYDSIDPDAQDADKAIDIYNGNPNSMLGYVGMGPAWARWKCAANHHWVDYTITVKSVETGEIKYKVWMGADRSQRNYYCFLSSAWGHNATFAFAQLDDFFPKIRGKDNKLQVAKYRLEYPYELSDAARTRYEAYVKKNS